MTKDQLLNILKSNNIKVVGNSVARGDLEKALGYKLPLTPEWLSVEEMNIQVPVEYSYHLSNEFKTHGRIYNPISLRLVRFGKVQKMGKEVALDGIVYQYSLKHNPRNIKYAYKLFADGSIVSENAALRSVLEAESMTLQMAKKFMEE
jgi:hypothetical protein